MVLCLFMTTVAISLYSCSECYDSILDIYNTLIKRSKIHRQKKNTYTGILYIVMTGNNTHMSHLSKDNNTF